MSEQFLTAMGLPDDMNQTVLHVLEHCTSKWEGDPRFEHIANLTDPSGISATVMIAEEDVEVGFAVLGQGTLRVDAVQLLPGVAMLDVYDADGSMLTRVLAFVDDPQAYPLEDFHNITHAAHLDDFHLGAIAVDMQCYDTREDWREATKEQNLVVLDDGKEVMIGPRFVTSPWLFALASGEATQDEISPVSHVIGVINAVDTCTNAITGEQFYRLSINMGVDIPLVMPIDTTPAPTPGGVVDGRAFLCGSSGIWVEEEH
ncbi:hypothetical protein [Corynebacterium pelargi]|uniref:Uncharacterized protein n=1 Tax=Corynebacterium pelargi TaxID=1471400 RepID=A0A410W7P2_9CORY|nr:hypothetical protein [Corynebacterium pelargi]QAU51977.1 hypothetical protein CPELA_03490 [Corynebacterium pelargi]GGG71040.1 hypothetical protein GCM10007338_05010 [Corynebacterium pelargi]